MPTDRPVAARGTHPIGMRERHPVMAFRPELAKTLDILEADDAHAYPL
jgi:hypothetical protein